MGGETGSAVRRERRLKDRVPVRLRHHWKPAATLGVGLAAMVFFLGDVRISPYVTSASRAEGDPITEDIRGTVGLYDTSVSHSIQLTYKQTDFDKMMKEFKEDGNKDYIAADLVIDGVYLDNVGIRLKGNSTLSSLRGNRGMRDGGGAGGVGAGGVGGDRNLRGFPQGAPGGGQGQATEGRATEGPGQQGAGGRGPGGQGGTAQGQEPGGGRGGAGGMVQYNLSADKPEELPWLVKIDEFVEGRAYQGEREISLRPGSNVQVPLNEALSLSLTGASGQKAERYAFTKLEVNDRPATARLMVEAPDTDYAADITDGNGVLYKAKAGGSFEYRGDDPTKYENSFEQLNRKGSQDLEPVMKLIKWANSASDEEFARDLGKYVDVDSLARYIASQNLLLNFDDMAGPGKNYLLWYDLDMKKFSVLGWDYNLTFSGDTAAGPDDSTGRGGGMPGGARPGGNTGQAPPGAARGGPGTMPEGMPERAPGGAGGRQQGGPGGGGGNQQGGPGGGGGGMSHILKTKFLALDAFDEVYNKAYRELYQKFYASGTATENLKDITEQARSAGVDSADLDAAVDKLSKTVTDRSAALAKNKDVTG
ncbi:CotH kinase family protein [Streptomyces sp. TN58]|uniref:CotH kinase family protein n=1 Tax=Streptomyces sp. TN58 TaxID=234612 RepID=UPI0009508456|nr:CotH kinase family protein [Streptomyces sp. TN58]APU43400.1 spore coat protein CotH [Streptomyces sp. TN58]